jgi:hypothetical protein
MKRARTSICAGLAMVAIVATAQGQARGQDKVIQLANQMQSVIDVILTPVGGQPLPPLTIAENRTVDFSFKDQRFDVQVVPRDEPDSGFRLNNVNLNDLANRSADGIVRLRGEFENGPATLQWCCWCVCTCCGPRWCCGYVLVPGRRERVAVVLEADLKGGDVFSVRGPKMSYEQAMGYKKKDR